MIKHFYSYHIEIESLIIEIDSLDINESEKKHLKELAESHIHNAIIDHLLDQLAPEEKRMFIKHINSKNHEETWKFLRSKISDVEKRIHEVAQKIKKELHKDIREAKAYE